jgi:glyoxylase-like metal-dependent hydrolase (beta-lactamase superfamily II)
LSRSDQRRESFAPRVLGTPKNLQLIVGDTDVFGDASVTLVSTPGHTPGHQSLHVHLGNSGFKLVPAFYD